MDNLFDLLIEPLDMEKEFITNENFFPDEYRHHLFNMPDLKLTDDEFENSLIDILYQQSDILSVIDNYYNIYTIADIIICRSVGRDLIKAIKGALDASNLRNIIAMRMCIYLSVYFITKDNNSKIYAKFCNTVMAKLNEFKGENIDRLQKYFLLLEINNYISFLQKIK